MLSLFRLIPGRTCSAANYLSYLDQVWDNVAIFVAKKDGKIVGFTQAEGPSLLEPKIAWLPFAYAGRDCPSVASAEALQKAETWMVAKGALSWKMTSVRQPGALKRKWGVSLAKERLYMKDLL